MNEELSLGLFMALLGVVFVIIGLELGRALNSIQKAEARGLLNPEKRKQNFADGFYDMMHNPAVFIPLFIMLGGAVNFLLGIVVLAALLLEIRII